MAKKRNVIEIKVQVISDLIWKKIKSLNQVKCDKKKRNGNKCKGLKYE